MSCRGSSHLRRRRYPVCFRAHATHPTQQPPIQPPAKNYPTRSEFQAEGRHPTVLPTIILRRRRCCSILLLLNAMIETRPPTGRAAQLSVLPSSSRCRERSVTSCALST